MSPNQSWYLVYSKPQQEVRALHHLGRQGFETFLPRLRVQARRAGRFVERVEPMFPRYLFTRLDADTDDWAPIRSTLGVSSLVRFGDRPAVVPADLVESLRAAADHTGLIADLVPAPVEAGNRVRVVDGLLQGYEGIVEARSGRERVMILLDVADRQTRATVSRHQVAPI